MLGNQPLGKSYNGDSLIPQGIFGAFDRRLCFMAHDDYYDCISKQDQKSIYINNSISTKLDINKFECLNNLYQYETYCPVDFIKSRKFHYQQQQMDKELWDQESLDLINFKRNRMGQGNNTNKNKKLIYFIIFNIIFRIEGKHLCAS